MSLQIADTGLFCKILAVDNSDCWEWFQLALTFPVHAQTVDSPAPRAFFFSSVCSVSIRQVTDKQKKIFCCWKVVACKKNPPTAGIAASESIEQCWGSERNEMCLWGSKTYGKDLLEAAQFKYRPVHFQWGKNKCNALLDSSWSRTEQNFGNVIERRSPPPLAVSSMGPYLGKKKGLCMIINGARNYTNDVCLCKVKWFAVSHNENHLGFCQTVNYISHNICQKVLKEVKISRSLAMLIVAALQKESARLRLT